VKTFNQLREKYNSMVKSDYLGKTATVFVNPSRKEFFELAKNTDSNGVRGYVIPDDKLYLWDMAFHEDVRPKILKGNDKANSIPIRIILRTKTSAEIIISTDIRYGKSKFVDDDPFDIAEIIDKNKPLHRLFSNLYVNDNQFYP